MPVLHEDIGKKNKKMGFCCAMFLSLIIFFQIVWRICTVMLHHCSSFIFSGLIMALACLSICSSAEELVSSAEELVVSFSSHLKIF